jgi:subtilisin family serine protease
MVKELFFKTFLAVALVSFVGCSSDGEDDTTNIEKPNVPVEPGIDPYEKYQWSFAPSEVSYATSNSHSSITAAQNYNLGENATIAIIDTCFDIYHEDLIHANVIATKNIANGSSDVSCQSGDVFHGELVFGVIGAQKYNSVGLMGVAPKARFILIKIPEYVTENDLIDAFEFAANHGASVISNSWGTSMESDTERELFQDMKNRGISVVFACGNEGASLDSSGLDMECEDPAVIGVGASNEVNKMASYSNYGLAMDVLAPAGEFGVVTTDILGDPYNTDIRNTLNNPNYTYFAGTSASTPLVAGVIALMQTAKPGLSPEQIREILINSGESVSGYKKVNAKSAIDYAVSRY